jgi:hypothetical protein
MSSALANARAPGAPVMQSKGLGLGGRTCSGVPGTVIDASREPGLVQLGHDAARYRVEFATT